MTATLFSEEKQIEAEIISLREAPEPGALIALAIQNNLDIDKLERLMELQERWQKELARRAYLAALAQFQSTIPRLPKNKKVVFETDRGKTEYFYAPLSDIDEIIRPFMRDYGLSKRWNIQETPEGEISVTCIVSHVGGHSEAGTPMIAPPDDSGRKNKIQQRASTVQYLQRYTLIGALGLTTADSDIDGRLPNGSGEKITAEQVAALRTKLLEVKAKPETLLKFMRVASLEEIPAKEYSKALGALKQRQKPTDIVQRLITEQQVGDLRAKMEEVGADPAGFLTFMNADRLDDIAADQYMVALEALERKRKAKVK